MTAAPDPHLSFRRYSKIDPSSVDQYTEQRVQKFSENERLHLTQEEVLKELVKEALWKAFPDHPSDEARAKKAAEFFYKKNGEPIEHRTVLYWLDGTTLPSARHLSALIIMAPSVFLGRWFSRAA